MEDNMFLKTAFIFPLEDGDDVDALGPGIPPRQSFERAQGQLFHVLHLFVIDAHRVVVGIITITTIHNIVRMIRFLS